MINDISIALLKKTAKLVAATVLEGVSIAFDKGAEYTDKAKDYVDNLDKKDISGRYSRKEKRNQDSSQNGWTTGYNQEK